MGTLSKLRGHAGGGGVKKLNDAFRKWFRESRIVDPQGNPLRVYHGTGRNFNVFDPTDPTTLGGEDLQSAGVRASFFTDDPHLAADYAEATPNSEGERILPVYLSLQNPFVMDAGGRGWLSHVNDAIIDAARSGKYDGAVLRNILSGMFEPRIATEYAAFKPTSIKSAIGNRGTWDPNDPRIDYAGGGAVKKLNDAFRKWFAGSRVVDPQGNPLVVYHGTKDDFRVFAGGEDNGIYFTPNKFHANTYAGRASGSNVRPVYLSMSNPYEVPYADWALGKGLTPHAAREEGYDGYIVRGMVHTPKQKSDTYVAFRPEQIKSAIGNRGTWDPNDPRIDYAAGGSVGGNDMNMNMNSGLVRRMAGGGTLSRMAKLLTERTAPYLAPSGEFAPILPRYQSLEELAIPHEGEIIQRLTETGREPKMTKKMEELLGSKKVSHTINSLIERGVEVDPRLQFWYGSRPLLDMAMNEGMPRDRFDLMMAMMSGASARNPVRQEGAMGSSLWKMYNEGLLGPETELLAKSNIEKGLVKPGDPHARSFPPGYGSLAQVQIFNNAKRLAAGEDPRDVFGEKMYTYLQNKLGNESNATIDVNALKGPVMEAGLTDWLKTQLQIKDKEGNVLEVLRPKDMFRSGELSLREARARPGLWQDAPLSPGEYAALEKVWGRGGNRYGITPAASQALGWYGSGRKLGVDEPGLTALKSVPELYIESLEALARMAAENSPRGETPLQIMKKFFKGERRLGPIPEKRGGHVRAPA